MSSSTHRIAIAEFSYEGNSFSLRRDGKAEFARSMLVDGDAIWPRIEGRASALSGAVGVLREAGFTLLPTTFAKGVSGGSVVDAFYQETRAAILAGVRAAMPVDGVYLSLHGAMICESLGDPEGDLLAAVRAIIGPGARIAASLDLHAHVTPAMVAAADILVGYETYPHVDAMTTGQRAALLLARAVRGEIRPTMQLRRINAIVPVLGGSTRGDAPMAQVARIAREIERSGRALSISYFPVQPWLDLPDTSIAALAITNDEPAQARAIATGVVEAIWNRRRDFELPLFGADDAVGEALARDCRTTLIIDATDSVGGGACGDSPLVLGALLRHARNVDCAINLVDAPAAAQCAQAGVGADIDLKLGASLDPRHFSPEPVSVGIESLHDGHFIYEGGVTKGARANMGPTAVVRAGSIRILITSLPFYEFGDEHYRACGIAFDAMRITVFKNLMNFRTLLGPQVQWVGVDGPGATPPRLDTLDWKERKRPFWPCDDFETPPFLDA